MASNAGDDLFRKIGIMLGEAGGYYQASGSKPRNSTASTYGAPYNSKMDPQGKPFDTMDFDDEEETQVRRPVPRPGAANPAARQNAIGMICCFAITIMMFVMFFLVPE